MSPPTTDSSPSPLDRVHATCRRRQFSHHTDQVDDVGASLPDALAQKYPNAPTAWPWYYVFPSTQRSTDPDDGTTKRHHRSPSPIQRTVREAAADAGLSKHATCHTLRHSFATHLLKDGENLRRIQKLLGHKHPNTTKSTSSGQGVQSPLDTLDEE